MSLNQVPHQGEGEGGGWNFGGLIRLRLDRRLDIKNQASGTLGSKWVDHLAMLE